MDYDRFLDREARRRRRIPRAVAIALAVRRGRRAWDLPERRERALRVMAPVAGAGRELDALARRHLVEAAVRDELIGRPWDLDGAPILGREHVEAALAAGRGVLAAYCHFALFPALSRSLLAITDRVHTVGGAWMFGTPSGLRARRWIRAVEQAGVPIIPAEGCFEAVVALLRRGDLVAIAIDEGGSEPTELLGMPAMLTSGPARMAHAAGAVVVPIVRFRRRHRILTVVGEPLDARSFAGWRELHHAVARVHDRWMRADPALHEIPIRVLPGF